LKDVEFHSVDEEAKMKTQHDFQRDLSDETINAIGGELLAGSGFKAEAPEAGFTGTEEGEE
jgi:hypothetical protein